MYDSGHFAAEAHLLHFSFTSDAIVYVSILLEESADKLPFTNNSFLNSLWDFRTVPDIALNSIISKGNYINPYEDLFPGTYSHFNYVGSLTTPPCTPGAKWFIFDTPVPISSDDVNIIRASMATVPDSKRSQQGNTNRPVQPRNGRKLYYSFGVNSKSETYDLDNSCNNEDAKVAKLLSAIAVGISGLAFSFVSFIYYRYSLYHIKNCEEDVETIKTDPMVRDNPLQHDQLHGRNSVL
jgi:hypothetical protein